MFFLDLNRDTRSADHWLRYARRLDYFPGSKRGYDDHFLRFAKNGNDEHLLRFAKNDDHLLRFAKSQGYA